MAAMGAESTPIVAARATIRNMDRIAWMKRVASRCARATVARWRARPLLTECARFSIHSPVQLALVPPREGAMHRAWIFARAVRARLGRGFENGIGAKFCGKFPHFSDLS